jgi:plastocyanin
MRLTKHAKIAASAVAVAAVALAPAAAGAGAATHKKKHHRHHHAKSVTKKVGIFDNYYDPAKLTIHKGSTVKWQWPVTSGDTHDVTLKKGPKGVKKFQSEIAASDYTYKHKFTVAGKYHIICSLHEGMTMDITVR